MSQFDWIGKWANYSPEKLAINDILTGESATYKELNHRAEVIAANLHHNYGIKKGDRIAILSPFNVNLIALFGAAQKAGFILVPLNFRLTASEQAYQLNNCEAGVLIYDPEFNEAAAALEINKIKWEDITVETNASYSETLTEDDTLFILYTSGTTGFPKGALYTHKMLFWNSLNTALRLDLNSNDITINCMPPFHTGGWNVLVTPLLHVGGTIHLMGKFDPNQLLTEIESTKTTLLMVVPTMLKMMEDSPNFAALNAPDLRYHIVGGETLPIESIEKWADKNIPVRQGYGLTEVGPNITSLHQNDNIRKRGSIGFLNFYVEGKIVNNQGQECAPEEVGEFWLKGPNVTPGYWNNDEATQKSIENGWFKTGDLVYRDEEGYIYVKGRIKDMFISGGENVYPSEIERVIREYKGVKEVAVIAIPDEKWGESGAAFISLENKALTVEEISNHCRKHLAKFKNPKVFEILEDLPKNTAGKIDKKLILNTYMSNSIK